MSEEVFEHTFSLNSNGERWVTTRRNGQPYSGMTLDMFLKDWQEPVERVGASKVKVEPYPAMPRVGGKRFTCNGCGAEYEGKKERAVSDNVRSLIAEARGYRGQDEYGLVDLAHRLADALEDTERLRREASAEERRNAMAATLERVREVVVDALANADDSGIGWDAEVSAEALHEILDSAPSVARPLPDREALARTIFDAWQGHGFDAEFEYQKPEWLEVADAVLAAIEKGGESNG